MRMQRKRVFKYTLTEKAQRKRVRRYSHIQLLQIYTVYIYIYNILEGVYEQAKLRIVD